MLSPRVKKFLFSPGMITAFILAVLAYGLYLWNDYRQLEHAFFSQEQFIPTRIYSDVARIAPPQLKERVVTRLKILSYSYEDGGDTLSFTLHQRDYPDYLLPDGHPQLSAPSDSQGGSQIVLHFDGKLGDAALQSIQLNGKEVPDIYLEPETIATLSKGPKEVRELVKFDDVPALVWKAIIAVEDQHFLEHRGLDPRGIARALWVDLRTRSFAQGGSTITLQLVKNLTERRGKNLFKKINEAFLALTLERRVDKEQILERYLNEVYLGQIGNLEIRGVAEGAKYFFGRGLNELNLAEIAMMAGQIRGTGYYSPYTHRDRAMDRMRLVLRKMVETGMIAEAEQQSALKMPIRLAPPVTIQNKAPYFVDFVRAELYRELKDRMTEDEVNQAGFRVYTTLDSELNRIAQASVANGIASLDKQLGVDSSKPGGEKLEGALASVDQSTGFIRALVGGKSYAQSTFNRILNMKRQVGSAFKPIVYLTAILKGEDAHGVPYGPAHPAEDHPWTLVFDNGKQSWSPRNYERDYMGWIDYRVALAHSINTVAAKLGVEIGIPSVIQTARTLGVQSDLPAVPSLSLGVAELSPIELLRVYETFANHGVQNDLEVIRAITDSDLRGIKRAVLDPKQVVDPGASDLLSNMLQSVFIEGTASGARRLGFDRFAAGKTGTTSNQRDSWFAGYTPQLTTVVWVGADEDSGLNQDDDSKSRKKKRRSRIELTGATSALPIWVDYMKNGLAGEPPIPFPISPYLQDMAVDRRTGFAARPDCRPEQIVTDWFEKTHLPKFMTCEPNWPASVEKTSM